MTDPADLPVPAEAALAPMVRQETEETLRETAQAAYADNTKTTYQAATRKVVRWVHEHRPEVVRSIDPRAFDAAPLDPLMAILPLHPRTVLDFLVEVRKEDGNLPATGTLAVYLSAIRAMHERLGMTDPTTHPEFKDVWKGLRRTRGTRQHGKAPLRWELLKRIIGAIPTGEAARPVDLRDKALLLIGFAGAFRRSELVTLRAQDVALPTLPGDPLILTLGQGTKTSTEPMAVEIPLRADAFCPVTAFVAWIEYLGPKAPAGFSEDSPVWWGFRTNGALRVQGSPPYDPLTPRTVANVVKARARAAGLSEHEVGTLSAHSLRSGAATSAAEAGVEARGIKRLGRWESYRTVDRYVAERRWGAAHPVARLP